MFMSRARTGHVLTEGNDHNGNDLVQRGDDGVVACESYTITPLRELLRERLQICTPKVLHA
jgi:hypothetical protein